MVLSQSDVDDFLALRKELPASRSIRWRKRRDHIYVAQLPVVAGSVIRGQLWLVFRVDHERHWTFKLLRLGIEVLRWDAEPPPQSHTNPPSRPPDWPRRFRARDHEHLWHPDFDMKLARPSQELEQAADHAAAFIAFCERANIDPNSAYQTPPPAGEQLRIPSP